MTEPRRRGYLYRSAQDLQQHHRWLERQIVHREAEAAAREQQTARNRSRYLAQREAGLRPGEFLDPSDEGVVNFLVYYNSLPIEEQRQWIRNSSEMISHMREAERRGSLSDYDWPYQSNIWSARRRLDRFRDRYAPVRAALRRLRQMSPVQLPADIVNRILNELLPNDPPIFQEPPSERR